MVLVVLISIILTILFTSAISIWLSKYNVHIPSLGTIRSVGVFAFGGDIAYSADNPNTQVLNWGALSPGEEMNRSLYLRSISNQNVTLTLSSTNWNPTAISNFMTLTWNYTGTLLSPRQTIFVRLTLSVSNSPAFIDYLINSSVENFNFDIEITAV